MKKNNSLKHTNIKFLNSTFCDLKIASFILIMTFFYLKKSIVELNITLKSKYSVQQLLLWFLWSVFLFQFPSQCRFYFIFFPGTSDVQKHTGEGEEYKQKKEKLNTKMWLTLRRRFLVFSKLPFIFLDYFQAFIVWLPPVMLPNPPRCFLTHSSQSVGLLLVTLKE